MLITDHQIAQDEMRETQLRNNVWLLRLLAVRLLGYSGLIQFLKLLLNGALMIVIYSFLSLSGYFTQATEVT